MSSQLQDYFEEAVETVARRVYARNRTPSDKRWENTHPEIQRRLIHDVRTVIDLWLTVTQKCLYCRGTGRAADGHPCEACEGVGYQPIEGDDE